MSGYCQREQGLPEILLTPWTDSACAASAASAAACGASGGTAVSSAPWRPMKAVSSSAAAKAGCAARRRRKAWLVVRPPTCRVGFNVQSAGGAGPSTLSSAM